MITPETSSRAAIRGLLHLRAAIRGLSRLRPSTPTGRTRTGTTRPQHLLPALVLAGLLPLATSCAAPPDAAEAGAGPGADTLSLRTENRPSGTDVLLQSVSPVSEEVVWVAGHGGTWLRSVDGGATWQGGVVPGADTLEFRDVDAVAGDTAWLLSAGPGPLSRIYRTTDGGDSWTLQHTATDPDVFLDCLAAWDARTAVVYGDATEGRLFVLRTEDGGATWTRLPEEALPPAQEGEGGFAASGTCAVAGSGGMGWIATGNAAAARVLRTEDRGRTWTSVDVPVVGGAGAGLTTLSMRGTWGMALGGVLGADTIPGPRAAVTEDGGRTWAPVSDPALPGAAYGSTLVWMAASGESAPVQRPAVPGAIPVVVAVGPGGITWTSDGGRSWVPADDRTHWAVAFGGPDSGWAVGPGGQITRLEFVGR